MKFFCVVLIYIASIFSSLSIASGDPHLDLNLGIYRQGRQQIAVPSLLELTRRRLQGIFLDYYLGNRNSIVRNPSTAPLIRSWLEIVAYSNSRESTNFTSERSARLIPDELIPVLRTVEISGAAFSDGRLIFFTTAGRMIVLEQMSSFRQRRTRVVRASSSALRSCWRFIARRPNSNVEVGLDEWRSRYSLRSFTPYHVEREQQGGEEVQISRVASSQNRIVALSSRGQLLASLLGRGANSKTDGFTEFPYPSFQVDDPIISIAAGAFHTVALSFRGRVYVCGRNFWGQLGLVDRYDRGSFTELPTSFLHGDKQNDDEQIISIAAGNFHTVLLSSEGRVFVAGHNNLGELGLGYSSDMSSLTEVPTPRHLRNDEQIVRIAAGNWHTAILSSRGQIFVSGCNRNGQLGLGHRAYRFSFTRVHTSFLHNSDEQIVDIFADRSQIAVQSSEGRFYIAGANTDGLLGLDDQHDRTYFTEVPTPFLAEGERIVSFTANRDSSVILTSRGRAFVAGKFVDSNVFIPFDVLGAPLADADIANDEDEPLD